MAAYRNDTFFFRDDLLFLEQARESRLTIFYLRDGLFEHFSPFSRLLDYVLVHVAPGNFTVAFALMLLMFALTLCAFAFASVALLGNRPLSLTLTIAFGQSLFVFRLLGWWTATANILPAIGFGLAAMAGYLTWHRSKRHRWLLLSIGAYAISLGAHEQAILLGPELLLLRLLVLEEEFSVAAWVRVVWRERWAWIAYGSMSLLAVWNYYQFYYVPRSRPGIGLVAHFAEVSIVETFFPALFGVKYPETPFANHPATVILVAVTVSAVVLLSVALRRRAWRAWALLGLVVGVNTLALAFSRAQLYGLVPARELYYYQGPAFYALLCVGCALSNRVSGPARQGMVARLPSLGRIRGRVPLTAVLGFIIVASYQGLFAASARAMTDATYQPAVARGYVKVFLADYSRLRSHGVDVVLLNRDVLPVVQPPEFAPFNRYDRFFPFFAPGLHFDQAPGATYLVGPDGHLLPVTVAADRRISPTRLDSRSAVNLVGLSATGSEGSPLCVTPTAPQPVVVLSLTSALEGADVYMRIDYATDSTFAPAFAVDAGSGLVPVAPALDTWSPHLTGGYAQLNFPLIQRVAIGNFPLGSHTCLKNIIIGHLQY